jgi:hypothetical protein
VIDVKAMVLVDIVDLTRVQLTFNDKFSVQLCKERKRDPAAQSLKAYDQSIAAVAGTACNIFLLGMNSVSRTGALSTAAHAARPHLHPRACVSVHVCILTSTWAFWRVCVCVEAQWGLIFFSRYFCVT